MKIPVETNIHENLNNTTNNSISFSSWVSKSHPSTDELRNIFINMDLAMKYIHGKGFCIKSFDPKDIKILNNDINEIKYDTVLRMPNDYNDQQELIREDIYSSAFLQIGVYTNCLKYLKPKFLNENFDQFSTFLPETDISYYRGVVQRGATVYLSEYVVEKKRRDLQSLEREVESSGVNNSKGRALVKSNGHNLTSDQLLNSNVNINSSIYSQLDNRRESAFTNFLFCMMICFIIGFIILFTVFMLNSI